MRTVIGIAILFLVSTLSCSTTKETNLPNKHRDPNYIHADEVKLSEASNAYDLIRRLRPNWLRGRGTKSLKSPEKSYPIVYVDEQRHGDIDSLRNIPVEHILEIQFLNASDAAFQFGLDHTGGAILVELIS